MDASGSLRLRQAVATLLVLGVVGVALSVTGKARLARADFVVHNGAEVQALARKADADGKLIATWGQSLAVLAKAGILKKRKVTGTPSLRTMVESAGGRYTGRQLERDKKLVTAYDDAAGVTARFNPHPESTTSASSLPLISSSWLPLTVT